MATQTAEWPHSVAQPAPERDCAGAERWIFRPSSWKDAPQILALFAQAGLHPNTRPEDLQWKYWQRRPDWPGSRSYVLASSDQIVAHGAVIPGSLAWGRQRARILQVIDWAALPKWAGAGMTVMKNIARLADVLLAVGGSPDTRRILPHIGFRPSGITTGYVRPLRPLGIVSAHGGVGWRVLPRLARSALWVLRAPRADTDGWSVRRIGPHELHRLAPVLPGPSSGIAVMERSEGQFRHVLQCPILAAELYGLERAGSIRGYFLLTFAPAQARLADVWQQGEDPAAWRALIQCAVRFASRHPGVTELAAWASEPTLAQCLVECGFHPRNSQPIMLSARGGARIASSLRVQMLDTDAAYLHHGTPELWA